MSSAIVSHISWAPYVKWTETVIDNCRHARFYATGYPHTTPAICPRWTYFFNPVYQMDQDGHIKYVRQSEQYQKSLHPQCLLFHSSVYRRNNFTEYKIKSCTFSLKEIHPKMSSSKRPPCSLDTQCVCIRSIHRYATGVFVQHYAQANAKTTKLRITVPLWGESIGYQWIPLAKVN